jgi:hypothetical protein
VPDALAGDHRREPTLARRAHLATTAALLILGAVHIGFGAVYFERLTRRALEYHAQGLMGVFAAFLNFACHRASWRDRCVATLTLGANLLGLAFAVLYLRASAARPSLLAVAIFAGLCLSGIALRRRAA